MAQEKTAGIERSWAWMVRPDLLRRSMRTVAVASYVSIVVPFLCGVLLALQLYSRFAKGVPKLACGDPLGLSCTYWQCCSSCALLCAASYFRPAARLRAVHISHDSANGLGWMTEALAVHALFGGFLFGVVMPRGGPLDSALHERIEPVTLTLLSPLFFAYTGLNTRINLLNRPVLWLICGSIVAVAVAGKLVGSAVSVRISGASWRESLAVGVLVNTRGLVELVILSVGLQLGILSPTLFSMMVVMALVSTFMTAPLMDWLYPLSGAPHSVAVPAPSLTPPYAAPIEARTGD